MPILEILSLLIVALATWAWLDSLAAREVGIQASRSACDVEGLQFLDDTAAIASLRLVRDDDGRLRLERVYNFEYSDTGDNRRKGSVTLVGRQVVSLYLRPRLVKREGTWD